MLEPLQLVKRNYVRWRGRTLLHFSGCDYFRLASHPAVIKAATTGLRVDGLNVAASRLTTGEHPVYGRLETALTRFFGAKSSLLVPSGYVTNTVVAQALAGEFSTVLVDARAHPALKDAALHFDCPVREFAHRDPASLRRNVARCGWGSKLIVLTEGMFPHDGSVAPLREYLNILSRRSWLLVDDAHGAGVLGQQGRGSLEHCGVARERIIQSITLSKAFGVYGGAILCSASLRERIIRRSRAFMGCTPMPLPLVRAALQSLELLGGRSKLREQLAKNANALRALLQERGIEVPEQPGPIVGIQLRAASQTERLRKRLLAAGIYPPLLRYGAPKQAYFRFAISSEHTRSQLEQLAQVIGACR